MTQDMSLRYRDPWVVPKIFMWAALGIFGIVFLPALLVAVVMVYTVRKFLTRPQWIIIASAACLGFFMQFTKVMGTYFWGVSAAIGAGDAIARWANSTPPSATLAIAPALLLGVFFGSLACAVLGGAGSSVTVTARSVGRAKMRSGLVPEDRAAVRKRLIKLPPPRELIPVKGKTVERRRGPKQDPDNRLLPMGRDQNRKIVYLSESELKTHGVILGSTGSGKTESIKWLAGGLLDMGYSGVILDLKEDLEPGGLRDFCRAYAHTHGIPYQEVALSDMGGYWYLNALAGMTADQAFDAAVASESFDDNYHMNMTKKGAGQMNKLLFHAYELLPEKYPEPSLYRLGTSLQHNMFQAAKPMLADIVNIIGQDEAQELYSALFKPDDTLRKEAQGFGLRLTNLYDSSAGRNVLMEGQTPDGEPRQAIDFTKPGLIYIGASSTGYKELAKTVSSSVLSRINALAASVSAGILKRSDMGDRFLIVDEANFIERSLVKNFLSRARSSGFRGFFSTQSSKDWADPDGGDDWPAISQNVNVALLGKMNDPESAEDAAKYVGVQEVQTATRRIVDGVVETSGSLQEDEEYRVKPEEFREFQEGEMIVRTPLQRHWCQVPMRSWELDEYMKQGAPPPRPRD